LNEVLQGVAHRFSQESRHDAESMIASAVWKLRERNPYPFAPTMNVISAQAEIHVASLRKFNQ
jgi:hypothetical protein